MAIPIHTASFADTHPFDAGPDPACHFDTDPDPDPACHFAADQDPDPIFYLMRFRIRIRIRILASK